MERGKLGVLGGMGPQATVLFYQRVTDFTQAATDQEHIETLILSDTQMPDRTASLLSGELEESRTRFLSDARLLENWGASCIAIPCNTSHAFLPWLQAQLRIPVINMIAETATELQCTGVKRAGILGTNGTVRLGLYHAECKGLGIELITPPPPIQNLVMELIYGEIKRGMRGDEKKFAIIEAFLKQTGCDRGVLACTELSVYRSWHGLSDYYLDALDVLARQSVKLCGYPLKNESNI